MSSGSSSRISIKQYLNNLFKPFLERANKVIAGREAF